MSPPLVPPIVKALGIVQSLSLLGLVAIFIRPHARWSLKARLPVALIVFASSATLLVLHIL